MSHEGRTPRQEIQALMQQDLYLLTPKEMADLFRRLIEKEGALEAYLEQSFNDPRNVAIASYYEKYFPNIVKQAIDRIFADKYGEAWSNSELPIALEQRFTADQLHFLFTNRLSIQPTFGCSHGCPFCGFDAVKGVRGHIAPQQLEALLLKYKDSINNFYQYPNSMIPYNYYTRLNFASDLGDYRGIDSSESLWTGAELYDMAKKYIKTSEIITRSEDEYWLNAVRKRNGMRTLDNATKKRLIEQEKRGKGIDYINMNIHGESNKPHDKGMGVSATDERSSTSLKSHSDVLLSPRGFYYLLKGHITNVSEGAPQGLVAVPIGSIERGPNAYSALTVGAKIKDVLGRYLVIIDRILGYEGLEWDDDLPEVYIFSADLNEPGKRVNYDGYTYQIAGITDIDLTPNKYLRKLRLVANNRTLLADLYEKYYQKRDTGIIERLAHEPTSIANLEKFKSYLPQHTDIDLSELNQKELEKYLLEQYRIFLITSQIQ
ncbi:MAG: hypothetical protein WC752_01740 [Patescibacteria group bacterium]|jgi:hypothetical protein